MGANVRRAVFETFRIVELRKWQVEMLKSHINGSGALQNALIIAPTSSGKTLVAVILMLRCLIVQGRDAILALPFVAIVAEKVRDLKLLATKLSTFMVAEYAGRKGHFPPPSTKNHLRTLYVATTEKANVIWKLLCKTGDRKREIGILVFDEIHMIQQGMRGIVMEELVTSFLYWADSESRLVAMSATVGNEQDLRRFVGAGSTRRANIFHVTVRPAEVEEYMVVGGSALRIAKDANTNQRTVDFNAPAKLIVPDGDIFKSPDLDFFVEDDWRVIARLVFDAVAKNDPVLVFCGTKASCVQLCAMLTKAHTEVYAEQLIATDAVKRQRDFLIGHLKKESRGRVPSQLIRGIKCGIGFHSTELSETERKAIEGAYARGIINVITCTSTLAMGVSRFEALLKQGADNVLSQMLTHSMYYNRRTSGHDTKTSKQHEFNGVTRLLMTSLEIGSCDVLTLTDVISVFKLTLLYQIGEKRDEPESVTVRSIKPLLLSLQNLLRGGFVTVLSKARGQLANVSMEVEVVLRGDVPDDDDVLAHRHRVSDPEAWIPSMSHDTEGVKLAFDAAITGGKLQSCDFGLRLSAFAVATAAGSLSLDDAAEFVAEIEEYQECLCLRDYLIFLYISLTKDMCRPIVDPPTATRAVHDATSLIGDKIAKVYAEHPARKIFEMVGLEENKVNLWARAKEMLRMGLKTIRDVALVDPPLLLSLGVTNMPKWTAVEIVSDARLHIMQDALELAAESEDCRDAISRRPVTTSAMS
ncbi:hypothetical protein FOCC_FOCC016424 [Frankliniella occidentalis]|nr:hypothetical protein FOCC_FOCC016424 [Frankliniella occidentalis]